MSIELDQKASIVELMTLSCGEYFTECFNSMGNNNNKVDNYRIEKDVLDSFKALRAREKPGAKQDQVILEPISLDVYLMHLLPAYLEKNYSSRASLIVSEELGKTYYKNLYLEHGPMYIIPAYGKYIAASIIMLPVKLIISSLAIIPNIATVAYMAYIDNKMEHQISYITRASYMGFVKPFIDIATLFSSAAKITSNINPIRNSLITKINKNYDREIFTNNEFKTIKIITNKDTLNTLYALSMSQNPQISFLAKKVLQAKNYESIKIPDSIKDAFLKILQTTYATDPILQKNIKKAVLNEYRKEYLRGTLDVQKNIMYEELIHIANPKPLDWDKNTIYDPVKEIQRNIENESLLTNYIDNIQQLTTLNKTLESTGNPIAKIYASLTNKSWLEGLPKDFRYALNDYLGRIINSEEDKKIEIALKENRTILDSYETELNKLKKLRDFANKLQQISKKLDENTKMLITITKTGSITIREKPKKEIIEGSKEHGQLIESTNKMQNELNSIKAEMTNNNFTAVPLNIEDQVLDFTKKVSNTKKQIGDLESKQEELISDILDKTDRLKDSFIYYINNKQTENSLDDLKFISYFNVQTVPQPPSKHTPLHLFKNMLNVPNKPKPLLTSIEDQDPNYTDKKPGPKP